MTIDKTRGVEAPSNHRAAIGRMRPSAGTRGPRAPQGQWAGRGRIMVAVWAGLRGSRMLAVSQNGGAPQPRGR